MTNFIDLHIHSSYSEDGDLSVEQIFSLADETGLAGISITDHDSVESIPEALECAGRYRTGYIPGVEVTTVFPADGSQQHILGFFIDHKDGALIETLSIIRKYRFRVAEKRIQALHKLGFSLDEERIWEMTAGRAPTATSIMQEVLENKENRGDNRLKDYFLGEKQDNRLRYFYREYFTAGSPAYVPFESISTEEGIKRIHESGGISVLAHPTFVKNKQWLDIIINYGIMGIEAISSYHRQEDNQFYLDYGRRKNILITAGSDFHGPTSKPKVKLGQIEGNTYEFFEKLVSVHNSMRNSNKK